MNNLEILSKYYHDVIEILSSFYKAIIKNELWLWLELKKKKSRFRAFATRAKNTIINISEDTWMFLTKLDIICKNHLRIERAKNTWE